jgi:hypothetical protein
MPHESQAIPQGEATAIELAVTLTLIFTITPWAIYYFRRVRMERPPIGTFNARDITIVLGLIVCLPLIYTLMPLWLITCVLALTFTSALYFGYAELLGKAWFWPVIGLGFGLNIWTSRTLMGTTLGWQAWWLELDILIGLAAVAVSNLYVQGGLKLKHMAWFALAVGCYDLVFTYLLPVTQDLVQRYLSYPLYPLGGFRFGLNNYAVGLGDLLLYSLFPLACYKAYGWKAARIAFVIDVVVGGVITNVAPLLINLIDTRGDLLIPSQVLFGPTVFVTWLWMRRRYGAERTMAEFMASPDNLARQPGLAPEPVPSRREMVPQGGS